MCSLSNGVFAGRGASQLFIMFSVTISFTFGVPTDYSPQFFDNNQAVLSESSFLQPPMQLQQVSSPDSPNGAVNHFESVSDLQNMFNFQYPDFHVETVHPGGHSEYLPQKSVSSTIHQELTPPSPPYYENSVEQRYHSKPNYFDHFHSDHQEKTILHKHISVHEIPEEAVRSPPNIIRIRGKPEKHVSIVFVKAPIASPHQHTEVILPEKPKHKTIVYLLLKKGRSGSNTVSVTRPAPVQQPKPEVHYIGYNKNDGADYYTKPQPHSYSSYHPH